MSKTTSIGIVGYGYWGPNLLRNFHEAEGANVVVCCDQNPKRLERLTTRFPSVQITRDFKEVLENPSVDALAIATPVHTHFELAMAALKAGKHVLVEKPMTMRVEEAEELVSMAQQKGLVLMVDHVFVYSPPVVKIKEIIDRGELGKLFFIDSVRINLGLFQHDVNVVSDLATHDLSIIDYLLGRLPRSLAAFGSVHARYELEDVAYLNLDFAISGFRNLTF